MRQWPGPEIVSGPGVHGAIVHRSPQIGQGYREVPERTAEAFRGGWFHSGGTGCLDESGYLYIVDRLSDMFNTGGVLVACREVEDALLSHPAVSEAAIVGVPDPLWIEAVTAFVVIRASHACDGDNRLAHARQHLAAFKMPK